MRIERKTEKHKGVISLLSWRMCVWDFFFPDTGFNFNLKIKELRVKLQYSQTLFLGYPTNSCRVSVCCCYSPRGVKERTGLVSRLLSLLASLLQPWLILGRGIRLPRANATQVTTTECRQKRKRKKGKGRKSTHKERHEQWQRSQRGRHVHKDINKTE